MHKSDARDRRTKVFQPRRSRGHGFSTEAARAGQAAHARQRPWRVRLCTPSPGTNNHQVYFKAPTGEGQPWKQVLRRAESEEEVRKIFAQAEAALDTEQATPVGTDVRACRTIRMLGEEYLTESIERGKHPRTMEGRESRLNAHILPTNCTCR